MSQGILDHFAESSMLGFDGSPSMLTTQTARRLAHFERRVELRPFRLQDSAWMDRLPAAIRAFVSCLVVHHMDGDAKRGLYRALLELLEPGGALLFADVIQPAGEEARSYYEWSYEADVGTHSIEQTGTRAQYERFVELEWNLFRYPDPVDKPSGIADHVAWLRQPGFTGVDVFWARSGHALYGGYKPNQGVT